MANREEKTIRHSPLHPRHIELRFLAGAVAPQRAVFADRVGALKDQFCHAVRREKIFDSMVSGPTKRKLASMPVRLSGEKLVRSSKNTRISSSQSISSSA